MPQDRTARWHRYWDKQSGSYDSHMRLMDRMIFQDSRSWACSRARGEVLEVAVGTGLNFEVYPEHVDITGIDLSARMLDIARDRAATLARRVTLLEGNAHQLPFYDSAFDSVVCTMGLCAIPDPRRAITEMRRVLRPGGRLVLVDHVPSSAWALRGVQRLLEIATVPLGGEHFLRRPARIVPTAGFEIEQTERFTIGVVERLVARKVAKDPARPQVP